MTWNTHHHMHGVSRAHPAKKKTGTTHHGKPGMHKHRLPGPARKDAWKHKGEAAGQG